MAILKKYKEGEKLGARKLNTERSQTMRNKPFGDARYKSPQGNSGAVPVRKVQAGLGVVPQDNFLVVEDDTYSASADERRVAILGGIWEVTIDEVDVTTLEISGVGDFTGTGDTKEDIAQTTVDIDEGETAFVYLLIYGTELGEITQASRLDAYIDTGAPATRPVEDTDGYQATSIRVLASITNTAGSLTIIPEHTGNIKTKAIVLDGLDPITRSPGRLQSLNHNQFGAVQVKDFEADADEGMTAYSNSTGAPKEILWALGITNETTADVLDLDAVVYSITNSGDRYLDYSAIDIDLSNNIPGHMDFLNDSSGNQIDVFDFIEEYIDVVGVYHTDLEPGMFNLPDAPWQLNIDHDTRYWPTVDAPVGVQDTKSYETTGEVGCDGFYLTSTAGNFWYAVAGFAVDTDGAIDLDANDLSTWVFGGGINASLGSDFNIEITGNLDVDATGAVDLEAGAASVWDIGDDLDFDVDGIFDLLASGTLTINGTGTTSLFSDSLIVIECAEHLTLNSLEDVTITSSSFLNFDPTGELQINGTPGVTVASWFDKGIFTGTIVEKDFDKVNGSDKVLVRV